MVVRLNKDDFRGLHGCKRPYKARGLGFPGTGSEDIYYIYIYIYHVHGCFQNQVSLKKTLVNGVYYIRFMAPPCLYKHSYPNPRVDNRRELYRGLYTVWGLGF